MKRIAAAFLGLAAAFSLGAKEIKILTIGNSFADSVVGPLPLIAKSVPDCSVRIDRANIGGCSLERHWKEYEQSLKDPAHKPYSGKKANLVDMLTKEKWDVVTLQQASPESWKPESYQPYAENLIRLVRKYAPQAEIVIQQTWSYRSDAPRLAGWKIDQKEMYNRLTKNYTDLAAKYSFRVIPSGLAVQFSREGEKKPFQPLPPEKIKELKPPALPDNSGDVVGQSRWNKDRKSGEEKLSTDTIHLNARGAYLQGCVWFATLFGRKTSEIRYVPKGITPEDAKFLQECAQKAVDAFPQVKK